MDNSSRKLNKVLISEHQVTDKGQRTKLSKRCDNNTQMDSRKRRVTPEIFLLRRALSTTFLRVY